MKKTTRIIVATRKYKNQIASMVAMLVVLVIFKNCGGAGGVGDNSTSKTSTNISTSVSTVQMSDECDQIAVSNLYGNKEIKCTLNGSKYIQLNADVLINGKKCTNLRVEGNKTFYCTLPSQASQGVFDIHVTNLDLSHYIIKNGIAYYDNCQLNQVTNVSVLYNNTVALPQLCGIPPFSYVLESGEGTLDKENRIFKALNSDSRTFVKQIDTVGNYHTIEIDTIAPVLTISPTNPLLYPGQSFKLSGNGGKAPYSFELDSQEYGLIDNEGNLTLKASTIANSIVVTLRDANNRTAQVTVKINKISVNPQYSTITLDNTSDVNILGGTAPYSIKSSDDQDLIEGVKFRPNSIGMKTLTITDAKGASVTTSIFVKDKLTISSPATTVIGQSFKINLNGGVAPFTYSIQPGGVGTVDSSGNFTSTIPGSSSILIKDSLQNTTSLFLVVQSNLQIAYQSSMTSIGKQKISVTGGKEPYSFQVIQGRDKVSSDGTLTSHWSITPSKIKITDSLGYTKEITINKTPSHFVKNSYVDPTYVRSDDHGLITLSGSTLNQYGESEAFSSPSVQTTIYTFPDSVGCDNGGYFRNVAQLTKNSVDYLAIEKVCFKMINPNLYAPNTESNWGMQNYQFLIRKTSAAGVQNLTLNLPSPISIMPNHYQNITVDSDGYIYVIAWHFKFYSTMGAQGKTLVWKFDSNGVLQ